MAVKDPKQSTGAKFDFSAAATPNFFTGSYNLDQTTGMNLDPLITGYGFVIWTKVPRWVESGDFANFRQVTQKLVRGLSGIGDIELQTTAQTNGFAGNEYHVATNIQKANTEFSLKFYEYSGSPIRRMFQHWVTGIRDPETGIATYPKFSGLDYAAKNHTGELLYVVTRPDADNFANGKNIEYASYWTGVMPKRIPMGHFNFDVGSHDQVEAEISFSGNFFSGEKVIDFAKGELGKIYKFNTMDDYVPNP